MAVTHNQTQLTWPTAANSKSVSSGSAEESEVFTPNTAVLPGGLAITLKADNGGTPASGDIVTFKILQSCGDPDGASSDEYDTPGHATVLAALDTNVEDPAIRTVMIPASIKNFKLRAENGASSNSITVSAKVGDIRG